MKGYIKRNIPKLFVRDLVRDLVIYPEVYIKNIVDGIEKEYPEYWKASNLNSKKDS